MRNGKRSKQGSHEKRKEKKAGKLPVDRIEIDMANRGIEQSTWSMLPLKKSKGEIQNAGQRERCS